MSSSETMLLIIGAGASTDLGFPVGAALADNIAKRTKYELTQSGEPTGQDVDFITLAARAIFGGEQNVGTQRALHALASKISSTVKLAPSIDNYLALHQSDKQLLALGKMAIAYEIALHEHSSELSGPANNRFFDFIKKPDTSWYVEFFRLLIEQCSFQELSSRLRRVTVITFNYDRTLEQFLRLAVASLYDVSIEDADKALRSLMIYHPYGHIGPLQSEDSSECVPYGSPPQKLNFAKIASQIRTFTEGARESDQIRFSVAERMHNADRTVFLGFGFLATNMQLLRSMKALLDGRQRIQSRVFGTAHLVSPFNREAIAGQVSTFVDAPRNSIHLENLRCAQLFQHFSQALGFA